MTKDRPEPRGVEEGKGRDTSPRGVVAFDMDGTLLDSMPLIGRTASTILNQVFGTPVVEAEKMYYRTTGKPFELQLKELYPEATPFELVDTARKFHEAKAKTAYPRASFFPEVPKLLKRLDQAGWKLVLSTGAEREMAELILERGGLGFFFETVLGAQQGTKDQHLRQFQDRWPNVPLVLVGDSRFDMEAGRSVEGVTVLGRACHLHNWEVSPADMRRWGASWADYALDQLPQVLDELFPLGSEKAKRVPPPPQPASTRMGRNLTSGGAVTYTGRKRCTVASCGRRASWRWKRLLLCDEHLREEASSAVQRTQYLKEARAAAIPPRVEPSGKGTARLGAPAKRRRR